MQGLFRLLRSAPPGLRQSLIYGFALAASKAVSLIMVPIFTSFLAPADYGRLDVIQTLADLLTIVIGMGLADTLFRFAGSAKTKEARAQIFANLFGFALLVSVLTLVLTQLAAPFVARHLPGDITLVQTRLILGNIGLSGVSLLLMSWLRLQEKACLFLLASMGYVFTQASLSALLLWAGWGVTGVLLAGLAAGTTLCSSLMIHCCRSIKPTFDRQAYRGYLLYGGPLIMTGVAGFVLGSFDRWLLADSIGTAALADYALAAKMALITAFIIQPFDMWWLPRRFDVLNKPDGKAGCAKTASLGLVLACLAAVVVGLGGPAVIRLMTPESYHGAVVYLPWLAALAGFHAANTQVNLGILSGRTTFRPLAIDSSAACIALIGYLTMIPVWGGFGAIFATALALSSRLAATYWMSQHTLRLPFRTGALLTLAGSALALLAFLPKQDGFILPLATATLAATLLLALAVLLKLLPLNLRRRADRPAEGPSRA